MIPIVIVCFNNHEYVKNMISCIERINKNYLSNIVILDNNSQRKETLEFLRSTKLRTFLNTSNKGPWVTPHNNAELYNQLPQRFILTDPDLELNPDMPEHFIEDMVLLSDRYPWASKIGLALDISDYELFFQGIYTDNKTIQEHELQFWNNRIDDSEFSLYKAPLDTTFCLVNKGLIDHPNNHIRIAGNFTCKHLPWYRKNKVLSVYQNYILAKQNSNISTTSSLIVKGIEQDYVPVIKNDQLLLFRNNNSDKNLDFWKHKFTNWEHDTFRIFDVFLHPTKTCIDIGGWIGTTCIYASRKSKDVVVVEADPLSYKDLVSNCELNDCTNVRAVHKAIFKESGKQITIEGNNESISQLRFNGSGHPVDTISMYDIGVDFSNVSLIKVDIEGSEEFILDDLVNIHKTYNIPLYVSFHYQFFTDKNLDRFTCLTEEQKHTIRTIDFPSILFMQTQ